MGRTVSGIRSYRAAMKNAVTIASFLLAVPGASFAKSSITETLINGKSKKEVKTELSTEAASVDAGDKNKNKTKTEIKPTKTEKKPDTNSKQVKTLQENEKGETIAKIFAKPFYTKVGLSGFEVEKITERQMALELGLINSDSPASTKIQKSQNKAPWQKIGAPYKVNGMWYIPASQNEYDEIGEASWYGSKFHGKKTANGEIFDMNEISIAHPTLPIPCLVEVTNLENGLSIIARVNDRGPFANDRLIDVSMKAAELLGFKSKGTAKVRVKYVGIAEDQTGTDQGLSPKSPNLKETIFNQKTVDLGQKEKVPTVPVKNKPLDTSKGKTQIGAFTDLKLAKKFASQQNTSLNASISEALVGDKTFYRVYIENSPETIAKPKKSIDHNSILASL